MAVVQWWAGTGSVVLPILAIAYCVVVPVVREMRSPKAAGRSFWAATAVAGLWATALATWVIWLVMGIIPADVRPGWQVILGAIFYVLTLGTLLWWEIRFSDDFRAGWRLLPAAGRVIIIAAALAAMVAIITRFHVDHNSPIQNALVFHATVLAGIAVFFPVMLAMIAFGLPWLWYNGVALAGLIADYLWMVPTAARGES
jgi:hypothetical protein